jgi:hypothetical protein
VVEFVAAGFGTDELERLNTVRTHEQVLVLSCVLGASGNSLDIKYTRKRELNENWSNVKFPTERPPNKDFTMWRIPSRNNVRLSGIADKLGILMHDGYMV